MAVSEKYKLEYIIRSSPMILFNFLTTPDGLCQWFAEEVDIVDEEYIFAWSGSPEKAKIVDQEENVFIRFQWDYMEDHEYFEFKISKSEVTSDTILTVTDFAEPSDLDDQKRLWDSQVADLTKRVGGA
jgi:uncharacterized protein YndB with AHSA1/START domain